MKFSNLISALEVYYLYKQFVICFNTKFIFHNVRHSIYQSFLSARVVEQEK